MRIPKAPIVLRLTISILLLTVLSSTTFGATYASRASGAWTTGTTWTPSGVPVAGDIVTINAHAITVTGARGCASITFNTNNGARTLTVNAGSSLAVSGNILINAPGNNNTSALTINGIVTVGGSVTLAQNGNNNSRIARINISNAAAILDITGSLIYTNSGGNARTQIVFSAAGNIYVGGDFSQSSTYGTLTPSTGTVTLDGSAAQAMELNGAMTVYNLVVNKPSGTATLTILLALPIGGTLSVLSGTGLIASDLNIVGNLTVSGGILDLGTAVCQRTAAGGTFSLGAGARLRLGGNHGFVNAGLAYVINFPNNYTTLTINAASTVEYYAAGAQDVPYDNFQYGNLILAGSGIKSARQEPVLTPTPLQDSSFTVNGTLTIQNGATLDVFSYVFYSVLNGPVDIQNGGTFDGGLTNGAGRVHFFGSVFNNNSTGIYRPPAGTYLTFTSETTFGNTTINGNALTLYNTFITGYTTSNVDLTITSSDTMAVRSGGTIDPGASNLITITGTLFTVSGTARVTRAGSFMANQYVGAVATGYSTGTVEFAGTGESVDNFQWGNLLVSGSASLTQSMTTAPVGNLTVNGTLDLNTYTINGNSSGKVLTLGASGILIIGGTSGGVSGSNFPIGYTGAPSIASTSKVTYDGTAAQTIAASVTYGILEVYNTAGVGLTNGSVTASTLTMTAGTMTTGANMVTVTSSRGGNGLINGTIRHQHTFTTGTSYYFEGPNTYLNFSVVSSSPSAITITSYPNTPLPGGADTAAIHRYYEITPTGGSGLTATLRLHYDATTELNGLNEALFTLWHYNSGLSIWEDQGCSSRSGGSANSYVEQIGIITFLTRWTITTNLSPLPVQLVAFTASAKKFDITLDWNTISEKNNYGFEIQRRPIGGTWTKVGFVGGNGTTTVPCTYSYTDRNAPAGTLSYRLKQIDFDGAFEYSRAVEVVSGAAPRSFSLGQNYPSPFNPSTTIEFTIPEDAATTLKVYTTLGQEAAVLFDGQTLPAGIIHKATFDGSKLSSGTYFYILKSGKYSAVRKMVLLK